MAGFSIKIDESSMRQSLQEIAARGEYLAPALKSFGEYMRMRTEERFSGEHDPEGTPWVPLSPLTYASSYRGRKFTKKGRITAGMTRYIERRKILTQTGRLRRSITYQEDRQSLTIGTNVVYGRIHQMGGQAGRGGRVAIPARTYLGFNDADIAEAVRTIREYFLEGRP